MGRLRMVIGVVCAMLVASVATAEHLEIGMAAGPVFVMDESFEAFSSDNMVLGLYGVDIRSEVASVQGYEFALFVGYRFGRDNGSLISTMDTALLGHDFRLGLRVRKDLLSWLGLFAEAHGGVLLGFMSAELAGSNRVAGDNRYEDMGVTWTAGGRVGAETHLSRKRLASRNINRFCFGGEISVGYDAHGDLSFDPDGAGGGDNAIATETLGGWGSVNTSGVTLQIAGSLYFF